MPSSSHSNSLVALPIPIQSPSATSAAKAAGKGKGRPIDPNAGCVLRIVKVHGVGERVMVKGKNGMSSISIGKCQEQFLGVSSGLKEAAREAELRL